MANVSFILGAEADLASGDEVRSAVKAGNDLLLSRLNTRHHGNRRRIPASINNAGAGATGTWVLDFGNPQGGSLWWAVEVVVTAADDRTAPAGAVAALYCGAPPRQLTATTIVDTPPLGSLIRPGLALPATFTFAKESFPIKDGENLFVIVYSPTTALTVASAVATVTEVNASSVSANVI